MLYNELGKSGLKVSRLGFGTMRLPTFNSNADIDETEASKMLEYGIENGINLIDTAYPYHSKELDGDGNSERFVGKFLKENSYRDEIILSTKSPSWLMEEKSDFDYYLDIQLDKLQTDYIDVYLLHSLTVPDWNKVKSLEVFDFLDECLASGKVKHVGFSSHIEVDYLIEILDEYPKWEVVMTQMNYLDEYYQSGVMGLDYLKQVNVGSMIMEPLRGGRLVQNIPEEVHKLWNMAEVKRTPVEWALQYLWNRDDVDCVLSGMTSLEQVKENIRIASTEDIISEYDQELIREVARTYRTFLGNRCTRCGYCMPCPHGVDIINCLNEYNIAHMMNDPKASAMQYFSLIDDDSRADSCVECMECLPFCTQMLNIPEELQKVYEYFGSEFDHLGDKMPTRYIGDGYWEIASRQMSIVTRSEQQRFKDAKITVIGCGGIGGQTIEMLTRMGIGELIVVDEDAFDISNLNRQTFSTLADVGLEKSAVAAEKVRLINPYVKITPYNEHVDETNIDKIISDSDIVIDALDNVLTRVIVSRKAKEKGIPYIHGAIHGTLGQITTFLPDGDKTYEEMFNLPSNGSELTQDVIEELSNVTSGVPPVIGPTPNLIACLEAIEAFKIITGVGDVTVAPKILTFDLLNFASFSIEEI